MLQCYPRGVLLLCWCLLAPLLGAQDLVPIRGTGGEVATCGGRFVDSGGLNGLHAAAGTRQSLTICSDKATVGNTHVELFFDVIDIRGTLTVRNGRGAAAPVIRQLTEQNNADRITVSATAANASGCLTVEFVSSGSKSGWEAAIRCVTACQPIVAELVSSSPARAADSDRFIDACLGSPITLTARGRYPEGGVTYPQDDATTTFSWTFQDGTQASGRTVTHTYTEPGGYIADVVLRDQRGCTSRNSLNQRIRVSAAPVVTPSTATPLIVCPDESVILGTEGVADARVTYRTSARTFSFTPPQPVGERIVIPESANQLRTSTLPLRSFGANERLGSGDGIVQICVDIEHDYVGDLSMWVECPSNRRVDLLKFDPNGAGAKGQYFGEPTTEPGSPEAGTPGKYCWSASGGPTVDEVARALRPGAKLPENILYRPADNSFDALAGCPLNGNWKLSVLDLGDGNGGTVFGWSIEFQDKVLPAGEAFIVPIVSTRWTDTGQLTSYTPDRIVFTGRTPGFVNQLLTSVDSFGCSYDTLIPVTVRSPYAQQCFSCEPPAKPTTKDTSICAGTSFVADLDLQIPSLVDTVRWQAHTSQKISRLNATPTAPFRSTLRVTDQLPATFSDPTTTLAGVCIDYRGTGNLTGLSIQLISPGGTRLPLVTPGQLTGRTFRQCITPSTAAPWSALRGQPVNGNWVLEVSDTNKTNRGTLLSWSVDLVREPPVTYSWSPASPDFSCTDCARPTVTPTQPGTYTLRATTADGCSGSAKLIITLQDITVDFTPNIFPGCADEDNGSIQLTPATPTRDLTYAWSNGARERDLFNLSPGPYTLTVTATNGCRDLFTYRVPSPDPVGFAVVSVTPVTCNGEATGTILTTPRGGTAPYTFRWSDPSIPPGAAAGAVKAGVYTVTVTDANGCSSDTTATVTEPAALQVAFTETPTPCRGGAAGALMAAVTGGTGPYALSWSTGEGGPTIQNLAAGAYQLTVTDGASCSVVRSARVTEPAETFVVSVVDTVGPCAGQTNGRAAVFSSGPPPASYRWSNGETTQAATRLPAGTSTVTVTDENGCERPVSFILQEREQVDPVIAFQTDNLCDPGVPRYLSLEQEYPSYAWSTGDTTRRIADPVNGMAYAVTVTTGLGCTATASFDYAAPRSVELTADITAVTCFGTRTGAIEVAGVSGPLPGPYSLEWGENTDFATGDRVAELLAGSYALTIRNGASCSLDTTFTIPSPPPLILDTRPSDVSCFGSQDGRITTRVEGGSLPYRYRWSTGVSTVALDNLGPGSYAVEVLDANNCSETDTVTLESPEEIFLTATTTAGICGGQASGRIDLEATGGQSPYVYALNGTQFSASPSFIGVNEGDYTLTVRDQAGCTATTMVLVEDGPELAIELGGDIDLIYGDSVQLSPGITGATGPLIYLWEESKPGSLSCLTCPDPVALPRYEVTYALTVVDSLGCEASDAITLRVEKIREVAVPSGFSPNGDGRNDRLLVHGRPGTRVEELLIFDRWGGIIFQDAAGDWSVNDPNRGWNGNGSDNAPLNAGVYLYKLSVIYEDDSRETLSGQTTLIR